jgi:hypothetical protein
MIAEEQYDWRPADGVRSAAEVFMHVAAINFSFPLLVGHEAPASTGMTVENLPTAAPAYENSLKNKDPIRPELQASFENLRSAIESTSASGRSPHEALSSRVALYADRPHHP